MNPFDFVKSITTTKENLMEHSEANEKDYNPYLVNKALSFHYDTILYANLMNSNSHIDKKIQYDYYMNSICKKPRYSKWYKEQQNENVDAIMKYYGFSRRKAEDVLDCFTDEQLNEIKNSIREGGVKSTKK